VNDDSVFEQAFKIKNINGRMKRTRRKERELSMRREMILAEAEKIFSAKGYHNVTMAEIAGASGFSTGGLYLYFENKEDLYSTMIIEKLTLMYASITEEVESAKNLYDKLEAFVHSQLKFVEDNTDFCRIFLRGENELLSPKKDVLRKRLMDDYLNNLSYMENVLKAGIRKRLLRNLPARDAATTLAHLIQATAMDWMMMSPKESLVSKKEIILDIFLNGVKRHED
jgi:AcrR family transcriptional regulator